MNLHDPPGTIVLRVLCGQCFASKRRDPGRLGVVVRSGDGVVSWVSLDPRAARYARSGGREEDSRYAVARTGLRAAQLLAHPLRSTLPLLPQTLTACCPRHGLGVVRTADVLPASGTVVLTMTARA